MGAEVTGRPGFGSWGCFCPDSNHLRSPNLRHSKDVLFPPRQQMASHHLLKFHGTRRCLNELVVTPQRKTTRSDSQLDKWPGNTLVEVAEGSILYTKINMK